jgi:hypothetical protein
MINSFKNIRSPFPLEELDVYEFLERIKSPDSLTLEKIEKARDYKANGSDLLYGKLKNELPCFTLNFSFKNKKANKNIKEASGFIYIDVDGETNINLNHPLVFASWLSLSGKGRGILVKVNGLSLNNFDINYEAISNELDIIADPFAAKATQFTVHSYDEGLYINENSETWEAINKNINSPTSLVSERGKKKGAVELGENDKLRFDNIKDIDFGGEDYIVFPEEKGLIAKAFIPKAIYKGGRNSIISALSIQLRALNPNLSEERFAKLIDSLNNSHCQPPLNEKEINSIIAKTLSAEDIEPFFNTPRRVIFNPECKLNKKEKSIITNRITGKIRRTRTINQLKDIIQNWEIKELGKITQKKLAEFSGRNIKTIEKYYKNFTTEINYINSMFKQLTALSPNQT